MKSFACLIRHDTVVRIYISIQLRKHHVRTLGTNVSKSGKFEIPILRVIDIADGTAEKAGKEREIIRGRHFLVIYNGAQMALLF